MKLTCKLTINEDTNRIITTLDICKANGSFKCINDDGSIICEIDHSDMNSFINSVNFNNLKVIKVEDANIPHTVCIIKNSDGNVVYEKHSDGFTETSNYVNGKLTKLVTTYPSGYREVELYM